MRARSCRHNDDVIIERLTNLNEKFETFVSQNKSDHEAIIAQTTKTNGSVADIKKWKNQLIGGLKVVAAIVVPIFLWLIYSAVK